MMPITSKPLYVYLQRPDTGEWVTVGRYQADSIDGSPHGRFRYAPSYADAGQYCDALLLRIENAFGQAAGGLEASWRAMLHARLQQNLSLLRVSK